MRQNAAYFLTAVEYAARELAVIPPLTSETTVRSSSEIKEMGKKFNISAAIK